jgi:predicted nucleotide-binding protein (sugar kinase/HSP70/actin superfamily)
MSSAGLSCPDSSQPHVPHSGSPSGNNGGGSPARPQHYRRPHERPFLASERNTTTILIGGLTEKHERFIRAVFRGSGYDCERLPTPDQSAFQIGKEYGNNGVCSPCYFTAGSLIHFLKSLEAEGMSRTDIVDRYLFFTAGSCGPCRFAMYAAEYRMALENAGFHGFRVIRFQQDDGINQRSSHEGLKYTLDFGVGMLKTIYLADVMNDLTTNIRPYEVIPGETNRVMELCMQDLCEHLTTYKAPELSTRVQPWVTAQLAQRNTLRNILSTLFKFRQHLYGDPFLEVLHRCRERINGIEVDRFRVKPVVKIIGEFWAQTTEGDGNYRMFDFLEREGAHVQTEAIGTWIDYLLEHAGMQMEPRRGLDSNHQEAQSRRGRLQNELNFRKKRFYLKLGERFYRNLYHHVIDEMGGTAHRLVNQEKLALLAKPFYRPLARGGEGYLEVGKNIYYTVNKLSHMVLSLKPFGCMPSSMSDGIQSAVVNRFKDMIFLPIETSGEGEVNAHSRVQMALGEAKTKAKAEYQEVVARTGRSLEQIRAFVSRHPQLRKPLYKVPHHHGVTGVAANFVLHVNEVIAGRAHLPEA